MKPRIVIALSNDQDYGLRQLDEELRRIQLAMDRVCELRVLPAARLEDIYREFDENGDRIVGFHFAGHADSFNIYLKEQDGRDRRVYGRNLLEYIAGRPQLRFIFLNACATYEQAAAMIRPNGPCVVATATKVKDSAARMFATHFYHSLSTGRFSLTEAFLEAERKSKIDINYDPGAGYRGIFLEDPGEEHIPWHFFEKQGPVDWKIPASSGGRTITKLEDIIPYINRDAQWQLFEKVWLLATQYPNICIIPGDPDSLGHLLVRRIREKIEKDDLHVTKFTPVQLSNWVVCDRSCRDMLAMQTYAAFRMQYEREIDLRHGQSILKRLGPGEVVLLQVQIQLEDWSENAHRALRWYIEEFWNFQLPDSRGPRKTRILIVLQVLTPRHPGWLQPLLSWQHKYRVFQHLRQLRADLNVGPGPHLVFPRLEKISLSQIQQSFDAFTGQLQGPFRSINLRKLFSSYFLGVIPYSRKWTLREVEERLLDYIHSKINDHVDPF